MMGAMVFTAEALFPFGTRFFDTAGPRTGR